VVTNHKLRYVLHQLSQTVDFPEERVKAYWEQLVVDKLAKVSFYSGTVKTADEFVEFNWDTKQLCFLVHDKTEDRDVAHVFLNSFQGKTAFLHFSVLKSEHGRASVKIGKQVIKQLFRLYKPDGTFAVDCLAGLTPLNNIVGCAFVERVGFRPITVWPGACYIEALDTYIPGLITQLTRDEIEDG
jgi:hypothetical protein